MPDGRPVADEKNNLGLGPSDGTWTEPVLLEEVSRRETAESYATITADGQVYCCQEPLDADGDSDGYDLYSGRLQGNRLIDSKPFAPAATGAGEGIPGARRMKASLFHAVGDGRRLEHDRRPLHHLRARRRGTKMLPMAELMEESRMAPGRS